MFITRARVSNVRSIENLDWSVTLSEAPGWHVILGDNGAGKSSFLRSIAVGLVGPKDAQAFRQDWNQWLRQNADAAEIRLDLWRDRQLDEINSDGGDYKKNFLPVGVRLDRPSDVVNISQLSTGVRPDRFVWNPGERGWFSASYGPFRRFGRRDRAYEGLFASNPRIGAHLSAFDDSIPLTEGVSWLQELSFLTQTGRADGHELRQIIEFVNQPGFLPHGTHLQLVASDAVAFTDASGYVIPVEELSDGYRSFLSMTFELLLQLRRVYRRHRLISEDGHRIEFPGVVLIDEIDAHLHPSWQRLIGGWLRQTFPQVQFIVATHSPLVCHAAIQGSVYKMPSPGSTEAGGMVTGVELQRLLYGDILEAYSTDLFGDVGRSAESALLLRRLAEINVLERNRGLSEAERAEQAALRSTLPTAANEGKAHSE